MRAWSLVLAAAWLVACPPSADTDTGDPHTDETDTDTDSGTDTDTDIGPPTLDTFALLPPAETDGVHTATHRVCANCHTAATGAVALKDASGRHIGPADLWPASVMAHASRDPLFRAAVAKEVHDTPDLAVAIEQKCMSCHAPAAWADLTLSDEDGPTLAALQSPDAIGDLAREGANCVGCHLQRPETQGDPDTFSGHHDYNDDRVIYGPHVAPFAGPMRNFAGFEPTHSEHMLHSEVCASCHTLFIDSVDGGGVATGHTSMEQGPYLEWQGSAYYPPKAQPEAAECQTCHMPNTDVDGIDIETRIARNPTGSDFPRTYARVPVARHVLYGGNTFLLGLVRDHRDLLGSPATVDQLDTSIAGTRDFLGRAATLTPGPIGWANDSVTVPIVVENRTGHKLPTGYPSRRVWLEVEVRDGSGSVVWHLGAVDALGRLVDEDGTPLPPELDGEQFYPHRDLVTDPTEVIVWESVMADADGDPTTTLLRAASYAKDNRLLPRGFEPLAAYEAQMAPVGTESDSDFSGGVDTVSIRLTPAGEGPWTMTARLRYQAFNPTHLDGLVSSPTAEGGALGLMLDGRAVPAEIIAETEFALGR